MDVRIERLTPAVAEDYLRFFDTTPHDDGMAEHKCYCVCCCSADHRAKTDFSSVQKRRGLAKEYVRSGAIQGYLAYQGNRVVGWCNANARAECQNCISWLRFMTSVNIQQTHFNVKSVFCFAIAPEMQRKGIATSLLERVCEDALLEGFDVVESYPKKETFNAARDFMGPAAMYQKSGFSVFQEMPDRIVMRKQLK